MVSMKCVLISFFMVFVSGCSQSIPVKKLEKSYIVTGYLDRYWIDSPKQYICYYNVVDSEDLYSFSAIPPNAVGECTRKATVNLISKEVVWIIDDLQYLTKR